MFGSPVEVSAQIDVNAAVKDIWKEIGKDSGSFTVLFQNNSMMPLRFSILPKKNQFNYKGGKFEVEGKVERISDNISDLRTGQVGYYAFTTTGVIKAEVRQLIVCNYEAVLTKDYIEEVNSWPAEEQEWIRSLSPKFDQGIGNAAFGIEIYNETRRDKRFAMLHDYYFHLEQVENGEGEFFPTEQNRVFMLSKPQNSNLPVDELKINTFFKNNDKAVLYVNFRNNESVQINTAVFNLFNEIDKDRSGEISKKEFVDYCRSKSPKANVAKIEEMYKRLDDDKSDKVTLCEFVDKFDEVQKFINQIDLKFDNKVNKLSSFKKSASNVFST